ncbi:MAG: type II toxin-antitoxin system prevent-host-death family antitoxin [Enhydrobacter sp.]|nr:MAG: type II toxin-antitoxin system prevent-host-death family antitoxin [Enhydrobacter sp.]
MKKASISEAKNKLSALLDGVRRGAPVLIMDRGRPVARLEPVLGEAKDASEGRLMRLVRDGVVHPRRAALPKSFLASTPPTPRRGASAVAALLDERREGR